MKLPFPHALMLQILFAALPMLPLRANIVTDTQTSQANNLSSLETGVLLSIPAILCRNTDDDQNPLESGYEKWDLKHSPSSRENDLGPVVLTGKAGPSGGRMIIRILHGKEKINDTFWLDSEKNHKALKNESEDLVEWSLSANQTLPVVLYIEGYECSERPKDVIIEARVINSSGSSPEPALREVTVYEMDLDIDSYNNNGFEAAGYDDPANPSTASVEDEVELSATSEHPGKFMVVSTYKDSDLDGTPDFADGLGFPSRVADQWHPSTETTGPDFKLVPMVLRLKKPLETSTAKIKFSYPASIPRLTEDTNPGDIERIGSGDPGDMSADPPKFPVPYQYYLKKSGMRIWTIDAPDREGQAETREDVLVEGGRFVPDGVEIPWKTLVDAAKKVSPDKREITLYLEYAEAPTKANPTAGYSGLAGEKATISVTETAESGGVAIDSLKVYLVPARLTPDWNRDGKIDGTDQKIASDVKAFPWWVNDDSDSSEEKEGLASGWEDDIPVDEWPENTPDYSTPANGLSDSTIGGMRDLVDFFPIFLDLNHLAEAMPPGEYVYEVGSKRDALNFAYGTYTGDSGLIPLEPETAGKFLSSPYTSYLLRNNETYRATSQSSALLSEEFLQLLHQKKSILLVEGRDDEREYLEIRVRKEAGSPILAAIRFDVAIHPVRWMYRHLNLRENCQVDDLAHESAKETAYPPRATNLDEPFLRDTHTNGDWLFFLHGYNVNGMQARGWNDEMFKRYWQSGSKARFVGVSWYGDESQDEAVSIFGVADLAGRATPKFYRNVEQALVAAGSLVSKVNPIKGGRKTFASHSLGGMVLSEALANRGLDADKLLIFNAAFGTEALLPSPGLSQDPLIPTAGSTFNDIDMVHPYWKLYPEETYASEWHRLFPSTDSRSKLTWRGRFTSAIPKMSVFYSEGEEVLARHPDYDIPGTYEDIIWPKLQSFTEPLFPTGRYAWAVGQKLTGRRTEDMAAYEFAGIAATGASRSSCSSPHAGWGMNLGVESPQFGYLNSSAYFDYQPPSWFGLRLANTRQEFLARLQRDPFFGATTPPNCNGLFAPDTGADKATKLPVQRTVLSQMIPFRTLPVGGAGGSGGGVALTLQAKLSVAGINIDAIDMQKNQNDWPSERKSYAETEDNWLHGDIKDVAVSYTWNVMAMAVEKGELSKTPPSTP